MTEALQAQPSRDSAAGVDTLLAEAWACRHESVPRAEALLQQALRAAQSIDYRRGQAYAILRLALCGHMRRQDPQLVDSSLQLALGMLRELQDRAGQAEALNLQANLLSTSGHAEQAVDLHRQALALRQALNDRSGEAGSLLNMANELLALSRTDEAIDHLRQSMAAARACGDTEALAYAHNTLAHAFRHLEDWPSALAALDEALRLVRRTQVRALECTVLTQRGLVLHRLVQRHEARACLDAALALAQATGNQGDLIRVHQALGELSQDQPEHATDHLHQALLAARRAGDRDLEPLLLLQLGHAQRAAGSHAAAVNLAREALVLAEAGGYKDTAAQAQRLLDLMGAPRP